MGEGDFPKNATTNKQIYPSEINTIHYSMAPIGSVMPWLKNFTNTPSLPQNWVECNGQTLSDADSVYNGQVIPDLNGDNRFLRGNSTSGDTGGVSTINLNHRHTRGLGGAGFGLDTGGTNSYTDYQLSATQSILPPYYNIVWVMRIK